MVDLAWQAELYRISCNFFSEVYQWFSYSSFMRCRPQVTMLHKCTKVLLLQTVKFASTSKHCCSPPAAPGADTKPGQSIALPCSSHKKLLGGAGAVSLAWAPALSCCPQNAMREKVCLFLHWQEDIGAYFNVIVHPQLRYPAEDPFWHQKILKKDKLLRFLQLKS